MRARVLLLAALFAVCSVSVASALDRDARVIGQAGIDFVSYKEMNAALVTVWDETALNYEREWAIVAGVGVGEFFSSGADDNPVALFAALGVKWYARPTTCMQLLGTCEWVGSGGSFRVMGGTASLEQRLTSEQGAVSPFVSISASLQSSKVDPWGGDEESFTCLLLQASAGCDFILSEDVTLVFRVGVTDSQDSGDSASQDYADGWNGTVALKYFWF